MAITDPRDISGLVAWYSADVAALSYSNGAEVLVLEDLSGAGNDATGTATGGAGRPKLSSSTGPSGGPAIDFTTTSSGGYFVLPDVFSGATEGEIMLTVKAEGASLSGLWKMGAFSGPDDGNYYPHAGMVYDSFGLPSGHRQSFTPGVAITAWRRLNVWSAASDWSSRIDESVQATYTGASSPSFPSAPLLGRTAASGSLVDTLDGQMGCVVIYDRKLTTGERSDLATWLDANPSGGDATVTDATSTLSATTQRDTAALSSDTEDDAPVNSTLAATEQRDVATMDSAAVPVAARTSSMAAVAQADEATFASRAVTPITPAPPSVVTERSVVVAQAFGAVTMNGTQPVYTVSEAHTPRARQQIVVDGIDVTYFRDVVTPDVTYTLLEPLLYGPGTLTLPQVSACFERPAHGVLSWLRPGVTVEVHRVIDDVVVGTDYKGVVVAFDTSGRNLSVELGGEASGRAALRNRQPVIFPRVNDIGHQISDAVRDLGLPHLPALGVDTGIEVMTTGGVGHLEHIQNLVAKAWTLAGGHWTVMPNEATGIYQTFQKDEETIHATAFLDDARTVGTLRRDISEEPNRVYPTAVSPEGERLRGAVYPDLNQGPVPPFPGFMESGDTGDGVRLLLNKLQATNYLRLADVAGGYDFDVVEAVKDLQEDAGLPKTGDVDEDTWDALYDLSVTTPSLISAHIEPTVQRSVVKQKHRSASGTVLGFNEDYDPDVLKVDLNVDMGTGLNRSQVRRFARAKLHDSDDANWVGDIKFATGALLRGEVAVGATVAEADVMDARELRPGMNIWLPQFAAGKLVHVSACQVDGDGIVTASVDTRFRDAMEVWEVIARNKESRNDPARRRNRDVRSSTIQKDSVGEWDAVGGEFGHDIQLEAGWNVMEIVGAGEGTISRIRIELEDAVEFACAVTGRKVDVGFYEDTIGNPLTEDGERNWRRKNPRAQLRERWLLYSSGTPAEPCGYGEDLKSDGAELTGVHEDDAGFGYRSESRTLLYVAVWVPGANVIPAGRVLWPQLEAGA